MNGMISPTIVMGGLGILFGCLLAYASQKFFVETDPRQTKIRELLPGANCGGCGFPGCDGYAEACVSGEAKPNKCAAGGPDVAAKIAEVLGVSAGDTEPKVAFVKCKGSDDKTIKNCVYQGVEDCRSASVIPGRGPSACAFGCIGLGTCTKVCIFGAISIKNGVATVDETKCVGCGTCASQCPRGVIAIIPKKSKIRVACSNPHRGPLVKQVCSAGCIGCTLCVKACPKQAIEMKGNVAVIDYSKCVNCGLCASKCPAKAISDARPPRPMPKPAQTAVTAENSTEQTQKDKTE